MPLPARRRETTLKIEGTFIMFRPNFAGEEGKYNKEGERFFNVAVPSEEVDNLRADGWNVKEWVGKDSDEEVAYYLKVNVSYKFKPPRLVLITSRGRVPLDEETCDVLDWNEYEFIDVIISASYYNINGRSGISGYIKTGMFVIAEDELEQKYSHLPEVGMDPVLALPPGEEDPNIVDGEVVGEWETDDDQLAISA
jgi:hypothetical protein